MNKKLLLLPFVVVSSVCLTSCLQLLQPLNSQNAASSNITYEGVTPFSGKADDVCKLYWKYTKEKNSDYARREIRGLLAEFDGTITRINTKINFEEFYANVTLENGNSNVEYWDLFGSTQNWKVGEKRKIKGIVTDFMGKNSNKGTCTIIMNNIYKAGYDGILGPGQCTTVSGNYKTQKTLCMPSRELSPQ